MIGITSKNYLQHKLRVAVGSQETGFIETDQSSYRIRFCTFVGAEKVYYEQQGITEGIEKDNINYTLSKMFKVLPSNLSIISGWRAGIKNRTSDIQDNKPG